VKRALLVAMLWVSGCATDEHAEERGDASRWDDLAHGLAAMNADYCAAEPWLQPWCVDAAAQHAANARARLDEIRAIAARMDEHMTSYGRPAMADGACTANALAAEVDRHAGAVCGASSDEAASEARRHCTAMLDLAAQMHLRSEVAMHAMTTTYYSGSGSMGMVPRQTSAGHHDWPWAAREQPEISAMCPSSP
jgi:hypothetical protein